MASVYRNSHLSIAAIRSANSHGGLFSRTKDFEVFGKTPDGEDYFLYSQERIDHHIKVAGSTDSITLDEIETTPETSGHSTIVYHPLLTRAWVY
jgi:hypothetical protein